MKKNDNKKAHHKGELKKRAHEDSNLRPTA